MERNIDMKEVSDGKLYGPNDMVKADCGGCKGCFTCCCGMGSSIVLDPLDMYRLTTRLHKSFEQLLGEQRIELNVSDGIVLPNLKMSGEGERCTFLNREGRCDIHTFRPGICRLFPLGRFYENNSFQYFLQVHECPMPHKAKVKVKKWIDTPNLMKNEQFVRDWHYYLKGLQEQAKSAEDEETAKRISMQVLQNFYIKAYLPEKDFYEQFYENLRK